MNAAITPERVPRVWWKAISLAVATAYVPFVFMATYTSLFVPCSHCKTTTWTLLPAGPGLVGSVFLLRGFPAKTELMLWSTCAVLDLLILTGLTLLARQRGRGPTAVLVSASIIAWFLAGLTLMLIRA